MTVPQWSVYSGQLRADIAHAASGQGRRVSAGMVDRIAAQVTDLQRADDTHGGGDLIIEAEAHPSFVTRLLDHGSYTEAQERRLFARAADLSRMAGWMAFDDGRHAAAQLYFAAALRAAHTSGDVLLGANVLPFAAVQHYSVGNPSTPTRWSAPRRAPYEAAPPRPWTRCSPPRQARALAKAGDAPACYRALNRAADLLDEDRRDDDPPWAYWVEQAEIDMLTGSSLLDLGRPAEAQVKFRAADAAYGPGYVRTHALYLTRMATAQLQQRDVDAACGSATQALDLLADINSARSIDHVQTFAKQLLPYQSTPVAREFLERARTAIAL
ncbi:hypothetical protein ACFPH6_08795 [Streptomyces xiangluensis]|uniref:Transcriptional regulator n=1 Tax=Streptomyces xiangluensis TaxID=2665720 RepID=A0ABV8YH80_9ACTN